MPASAILGKSPSPASKVGRRRARTRITAPTAISTASSSRIGGKGESQTSVGRNRNGSTSPMNWADERPRVPVGGATAPAGSPARKRPCPPVASSSRLGIAKAAAVSPAAPHRASHAKRSGATNTPNPAPTARIDTNNQIGPAGLSEVATPASPPKNRAFGQFGGLGRAHSAARAKSRRTRGKARAKSLLPPTRTRVQEATNAKTMAKVAPAEEEPRSRSPTVYAPSGASARKSGVTRSEVRAGGSPKSVWNAASQTVVP